MWFHFNTVFVLEHVQILQPAMVLGQVIYPEILFLNKETDFGGQTVREMILVTTSPTQLLRVKTIQRDGSQVLD